MEGAHAWGSSRNSNSHLGEDAVGGGWEGQLRLPPVHLPPDEIIAPHPRPGGKGKLQHERDGENLSKHDGP